MRLAEVEAGEHTVAVHAVELAAARGAQLDKLELEEVVKPQGLGNSNANVDAGAAVAAGVDLLQTEDVGRGGADGGDDVGGLDAALDVPRHDAQRAHGSVGRRARKVRFGTLSRSAVVKV